MSVSRKDLLAALDSVKAAVSSTNDAIPERAHVWFSGEHIYGTNGGLGIKVAFETPFKCGLPGALLLGLLNQASGDTIEFKQGDGGGLKYKAGRSSINLATLPFSQMPWRFPEKPTKKAITTIKISDAFVKGLKRVMALKISGPKRMEEHAVSIFKADDEIDLYMTQYPAQIVVMPVAEPLTGSAEKIALPRELAAQIAAQCKVGKTLNMYSDHFRVQANDDVELFSNIFDTTEMLNLPQVAGLFSNEKKNPSTEIPKDLVAALERAITLSSGDDDAMVKLETIGKKLRLAGKFRYGAIQEEFELAKAITDALVRVSPRVLLAIKDVKKFSMHARAITFYGADDFIQIVATTSDPEADRAAARAQQEDGGDGEEEERPRRPLKTTKPKRGKVATREEGELDDDISDVGRGSEEEDA